MLPIPVKDYIPKELVEEGDPAIDKLASEMEADIKSFLEEAKLLGRMRDPVRVPSAVLDAFGDMLQAGFLPSDTDTQKRRKLATAVQSHKNRSTWRLSAKVVIDAFVGGDSRLFGAISDAWWVEVAEDTGFDWSAFAFDGEQGLAFNGIISTGFGDEGIFQGNVRIDVDDSTLTTQQVELLKNSLEDIAPAYFRVILGYTSAGQFIEYSNGRIG